MSGNDASREFAPKTFMWRELYLYSAQEWKERSSLPANVLSDLNNLICETVAQANFSSESSAL
jgi:hypothetical protein